jgi:threonine synthase
LCFEFFKHFATDIEPTTLRELIARSYTTFSHPDIAPIVRLDERTSVLELFHGPTLAFKDFALQLLGNLYGHQCAVRGQTINVLGATSGDTGSAAIHGLLGKPGTAIFILYPDGRTSPLQERQMACTGADNVFAIPIPGTFDDAQRVVKDTFGDTAFANSVNLSAVNSINIARVLAQSVYYLWACLKLPESARATAEYVVPTGNFGNVLAGWLAQQMGMPAGSFRVATNQNDILHRFFTSGDYHPSDVHPSHAPSMDIQAASNFERFLYYILGRNTERVREVMTQIKSGAPFKIDLPKTSLRSTRMDDDQIERVIAEMWQDWQYVLDPHTACAFTDMAQDRVSVVLATASPAKFPEVVQRATGSEPTHPSLEVLKSKTLQTWPLNAEVAEVKSFIREHIRHGTNA